MKPPIAAINALLEGTHADPFSLPGGHEGPDGSFARALIPGAQTVQALDLSGAALGVLKQIVDAAVEIV